MIYFCCFLFFNGYSWYFNNYEGYLHHNATTALLPVSSSSSTPPEATSDGAVSSKSSSDAVAATAGSKSSKVLYQQLLGYALATKRPRTSSNAASTPDVVVGEWQSLMPCPIPKEWGNGYTFAAAWYNWFADGWHMNPFSARRTDILKRAGQETELREKENYTCIIKAVYFMKICLTMRDPAVADDHPRPPVPIVTLDPCPPSDDMTAKLSWESKVRQLGLRAEGNILKLRHKTGDSQKLLPKACFKATFMFLSSLSKDTFEKNGCDTDASKHFIDKVSPATYNIQTYHDLKNNSFRHDNPDATPSSTRRSNF